MKFYKNWQQILQQVIFEADTPSGKTFDIILIFNILLSVTVVMLESVNSLGRQYAELFYWAEWFFTVLFTIEYLLRIFCFGKPIRYMTSFFGVIDFLSILPTFLDLILPGSHFLAIVRILRVLRIFRVLKLVPYLGEADRLIASIRASFRKIILFLFTVLLLAIILGSFMYLIEGEKNGFSSIPRSLYWAIVTLTTVGYGDISPKTALGQALASIIMIMGYGIIAVPTGIVTLEISRGTSAVSTRICQECCTEGHDYDASYCKTCGEKLTSPT